MSSFEPPPAPSDGLVRVAFLGDIVGKPGMRVACDCVRWLKQVLACRVVIANAENAADGSGLRCKEYRRLVDAGIDGITLGDHMFKKREIIEVLEQESNIIRPSNLPADAPGKCTMVLPIDDTLSIGVTCALGRVFMKPADCPFRSIEHQIEQKLASCAIKVVDFHAEATSDMQLMGRFLDGRVSAVLGTHTHVATADDQILPGGTGYQSDIGMTGPFQSILGRKIDAVLQATLTSLPVPFQVATEDLRLNATWLDVSPVDGKCHQIGRLNLPHSVFIDFHTELDAAKRIL